MKKRIRKKRDAKPVPYYTANCARCGRSLHMKKGRGISCPICDGGMVEVKGKLIKKSGANNQDLKPATENQPPVSDTQSPTAAADKPPVSEK